MTDIADPHAIRVGERKDGAGVTALASVGERDLALATDSGGVQVSRVQDSEFGSFPFQQTFGQDVAGVSPEIVFSAVPHESGVAVVSVAAAETPAGGGILCTCGDDGSVTATPVARPPRDPHRTSAPGSTCIDASFGSALVLAGATPQRVWVWEPEASGDLTSRGFDDEPVGVAWLKRVDPPILAVADRARGVTVLRYEGGELTDLTSELLESPAEAMAAWTGDDGEPRLATGSAAGPLDIWLWDTSAGRLTRRGRLETERPVRALAVTSGLLGALLGGNAVRLWRLDGSGETTIELASDVRDFCLLHSPGGYHVLAWLDDEGHASVDRISFERSERPAARLRLGGDRPLAPGEQDLLGFGVYARSFSILIAGRETATPLVVAIDGAWGTGKTSLGRMIDAELPNGRSSDRDDVPVVSLWFNAWIHDDAHDLARALASFVSTEVQPYRPWWRRIVSPTPPRAVSFLRRHGRVLVAAAALVVGGLLLLEPAWLGRALETVDVESGPTLFSLGGVSVTLGFLRMVGLLRGRFASAVEAFLRASEGVADQGRINEVRAELGRRIAEATRPIPDPRRPSRLPGLDRVREGALTGSPPRVLRPFQRALRQILGTRPERRLVLFVDDLDRCRPARAVEACETISQLLDHERLVTVVMVDLEALGADAEVVYSDLAQRLHPDQQGKGWGRRFLDKVFQFEFTIPAHRPEALRSVLQWSVAGQALPAESALTTTTSRTTEAPAEAPERALAQLGALPAPSRTPTGPSLTDRYLGLGPELPWTPEPPSDRSDFKGFSEQWGWVVLVAVAPGMIELIDQVGPLWQKVLIGVAGGIAAILFAAVPDFLSIRKDSERFRRRADAKLVSLFGDQFTKGGETETAEAAAKPRGPAPPPVTIRRREQVKAVLRDSDHLELGRHEAERWLAGATPRTAKRLGCRLLFTVAVAADRKLFWTDSPINGQIIGKWVTLVERWPQVGDALRREPSLLSTLEELARSRKHDGFGEKLEVLAPNLADREALRGFLTAEPLLGKHGEALARLAQ